MIVLGLTGSIGMGKSTTAAMFREMGVPVHDADAAVHRLYDGPLAGEIERLFPGVTQGGGVDRAALRQRVLGDAQAIRRLEAVVHPAVRREETAFLEAARDEGAALAVLDIPLLFETGAERRVDRVAVVTAPPDVQRARVLARPGMSAAAFEAVLARQMPDGEKRRRADFVIDTSAGLAAARAAVAAIVRALQNG